jgi:hypothetical protein
MARRRGPEGLDVTKTTRAWLVWGGITALAIGLLAGTALFGAKPHFPSVRPANPELTAQTTAGVEPGGPGSRPGTGSVQTGATSIVPAGSPLPKVTAPPARTIAYVSSKAGKAGDAWDITFALYGTGPTRDGVPTVVANVRTARPARDQSTTVDPAGNNMLLAVPAAADRSMLTRGGTYSGRLVLVNSGEALALAVSRVTAR